MAISWIVFAGVFGGSLIGMLLGRILHEDYLSSDSKDVIKLVMGLIATMSALVLALLISSAKASYDIQRSEVGQLAAGFVQLDRVLSHYGPETADARGLLRNMLAGAVDQIWSGNTYQAQKATRARSDDFADRIRQLEPHSEFQRSLYAQAMQIGAQLGQTYALLLGQTAGSIPMPFLVVLIFWLAMLFTSFGLYALYNTAVIGALLVGALSVACAIFLVLQLDRPFGELIQISSVPLRNAVAILGN